MSRDPYQVLGVSRDASANDVKKAYRKLAKRWHPDTNADDPEARERFAEATHAYDLLSDKDKRTRFDRGEIDADGNPRFSGFEGMAPGRSRSEGGFGPGGMRWSQTRGGDGFSPDDILSEIFGSGGFGSGGRRRGASRGQDVTFGIEIDLPEAIKGTTRRLRLPGDREVDVRIPASMETGRQIRLRGQGLPGPGGGPAGDALVNVTVRPHPDFAIDGHDLRAEVAVPLDIAVLGGKVRAATPEGSVNLRIAPYSNGGRVLRLKGKGLPRPEGGRGDLLMSVRITLPEQPDEDLEDLMRRRQKADTAAAGTRP